MQKLDLLWNEKGNKQSVYVDLKMELVFANTMTSIWRFFDGIAQAKQIELHWTNSPVSMHDGNASLAEMRCFPIVRIDQRDHR